LFDDEDVPDLSHDIDKERLKEDPQYREEVLMGMSARQSKKRFNRRVKLIIFLLSGVSILSFGILAGGYLEPFVARMVVSTLICFFVVPLMAYLLVIVHNR